MDTKNANAQVTDLAKMNKEQFLAHYAAHRPTRTSAEAPKVGDRFILCSDGRPLVVVRVEAKAKSCCFFATPDGGILYRNFTEAKGQVKRA